MADCDVIVIGSGFGGAVTACRLAEAGYQVLVLERGREWKVDNFPRELERSVVLTTPRGPSANGWFDFRMFPNMTVLARAPASAAARSSTPTSRSRPSATPSTSGWPAEITFDAARSPTTRKSAR